jgi:hypothetical protein
MCGGGGGGKLGFLPLFLLAKDLDGVLELREPCSFCVNVLPSDFSTLSFYLPSCDNLLFLMEPLDLLLNSSQLYLFCDFIFGGFVLPIFNLELLNLYIFLDDLNWRRCPWRRLVGAPPLVWVELAPPAFWLDPAAVVEVLLLLARCCNSTSRMSPKATCSRPLAMVERF